MQDKIKEDARLKLEKIKKGLEALKLELNTTVAKKVYAIKSKQSKYKIQSFKG